MYTFHSKLRCSLHIPLLLVLLTLISLTSALAMSTPLTVRVMDVGQGDSILVQFPNGCNMLVDAADRSHGRAVVDYLRSLKIKQIDILVATHPHADHIGGMADVLDAFTVGKVWDAGYNHGSEMQRQFLQRIKTAGIRYGTPISGFKEDVGAARIDVLAPVRLISDTNSDANNNSLVLRISYGKVSFLLTGDMETEERATIQSFPSSTVLKVAHHGSSNGTDAQFLRAVSPSIAVISLAAQNDYGHPHPTTLAALKTSGAKVYTTPESGTVVVTTDGDTVSVRTAKESVAAPASAAANPPSVSGRQQYIGNLNSHVFHLPSCSSLPAEKNRTYFTSRSGAVSQGYRPCGRCKP